MSSSVSFQLRQTGPTKTCLCFLLWFLIANIIIFSVSTFIANWSEHNSGNTFDKDFYLKQENNYRAYAILDLETVYNKNYCPSGWEPWLKNVVTPGTSSFCVCEHAKTAYSLNEVFDLVRTEKSVSGTSSNSENDSQLNQMNEKCEDSCFKVKTSRPVMLPKINSRLICAKLLRVKYDDYVLSTDGKCPQGKRVCGKDSRDFMCLDEDLPCPINRLEVLDKINNTQDQQKIKALFQNKKYKIVDFSDEQHLFISNEFPEEKMFSHELSVSNGTPCMDPTQHVISSNEQLNLEGFWRGWTVKDCGERGFSTASNDSRYSKLFTVDKGSFLNENKFFDYIIEESLKDISEDSTSNSTAVLKDNSTSPQYTKKFLLENSDSRVSIWHRGFLNFRPHCREKNNTLGTFHTLHVSEVFNYQSIKKKILGANTVSWVSLIFIIILLIAVFGCKLKENKGKNQKLRLVIGTVLLILSTSSIIFLFLSFFDVLNRWQRLDWLCAQNCGDALLNETFCYGKFVLFVFFVCYVVILGLHLIGILVYIYWLFGVSIFRHTKPKSKNNASRSKVSLSSISINNIEESIKNNKQVKRTKKGNQNYFSTGDMDSFHSMPLTMQEIQEATEQDEQSSSKKHRANLKNKLVLKDVEVVKMVPGIDKDNDGNSIQDIVLVSEKRYTSSQEYVDSLSVSSLRNIIPHKTNSGLFKSSLRHQPVPVDKENSNRQQNNIFNSRLGKSNNSEKQVKSGLKYPSKGISMRPLKVCNKPNQIKENFNMDVENLLFKKKQPSIGNPQNRRKKGVTKPDDFYLNDVRYSNEKEESEIMPQRFRQKKRVNQDDFHFEVVQAKVENEESEITPMRFRPRKQRIGEMKYSQEMITEEARFKATYGKQIKGMSRQVGQSKREVNIDDLGIGKGNIQSQYLNDSEEKHIKPMRFRPKIKPGDAHMDDLHLERLQQGDHYIYSDEEGEKSAMKYRAKRSLVIDSFGLKRAPIEGYINEGPEDPELSPLRFRPNQHKEDKPKSINNNPIYEDDLEFVMTRSEYLLRQSNLDEIEGMKYRPSHEIGEAREDRFSYKVKAGDYIDSDMPSAKKQAQDLKIKMTKKTAFIDDFEHSVITDDYVSKSNLGQKKTLKPKRFKPRRRKQNMYIDDFEHSVITDENFSQFEASQKEIFPQKYKTKSVKGKMFIDDFEHKVISDYCPSQQEITKSMKNVNSKKTGNSQSYIRSMRFKSKTSGNLSRRHQSQNTNNNGSICTIDDISVVQIKEGTNYIDTSLDKDQKYRNPNNRVNNLFELNKQIKEKIKRSRKERIEGLRETPAYNKNLTFNKSITNSNNDSGRFNQTSILRKVAKYRRPSQLSPFKQNSIRRSSSIRSRPQINNGYSFKRTSRTSLSSMVSFLFLLLIYRIGIRTST